MGRSRDISAYLWPVENVWPKVQNFGLKISHFEEIWGKNRNVDHPYSICQKFSSRLLEYCNFFPLQCTFLTLAAAGHLNGMHIKRLFMPLATV